MSASIRTLVLLGAVSGLVFGLSTAAVAQTPPNQPQPAVDLSTTPPALPVPAAAPSADASLPTVTMTGTTTESGPAAVPTTITPPAPPVPATAPTTVTLTPGPGATAAPTTPPAPQTASSPTVSKKTTHKKLKSASSSAKKPKTAASAPKASGKGDAHLRDAQTHLANLNYYKGTPDGLNGPKTRAAIKAFQHEHKLSVTGKLTQQTYNAILDADKRNAMMAPPAEPSKEEPQPKTVEATPVPHEAEAPASDYYANHPDFYGHYNQSYENAMLLGPTQKLYSRFGDVELTEDQASSSPTKQYKITLNGAPLILLNNQPTIVGVSRTYVVGDEDVMIFTSFRDKDAVCAYSYYLLILGADGTKTREINECSSGFEATSVNGTLLITFPESSGTRAVGSVWRYQHGGSLEKL
jgi:hypothetical protein